MRDLRKILALLLIIPLITVVSCKKDEPVDDGAKFDVLATYMVQNDLDLPNIADGWITSAAAAYTAMTDADATNDYYIIDIRSASDYAAGHIDGAVNTTLANVLTEAENANGKKILMVCYTGQAASHATTALKLSGFSAQTLKWGMSGWNPNNSGPWNNNIGDAGIGHANWEAAPGSLASLSTFDAPTLNSTKTTGEEILAERVQAMLDAGFKSVTNTDVLDNPSNYFINNYWAQSDVEHYGHIKGAHRVLPLTLAGSEYLNLDPSAKVVTYCWTGQTSSLVTAYLNVIGYEAYSLLFGANGMIHTDLESHKWDSSLAESNPVVTK